MYLPTSEALAAKAPGLSAIIEEIDRVLANGGRPMLTPDILAARTGRTEAQSESALEQFERAGVVQRVVCVRCRNEDCGQLVELDGEEHPERCTQCDGDAFEPRHVPTFWLSETGAEELDRASAGLGSMTWPSQLSAYRGKVDAVVITMRDDEFAAIIKRFPAEKTIAGRRRYNFGRVPSGVAQRQFLVATLKLPEQGTGEAQAGTRDAIEDLDPAVILLVGIAGGTPGEVTLGDVVFGNRVYDLTVQAAEPDGSRTFSTTGGAMREDVRRLLANLQVDLAPFLGALNLPPLPPINYNAAVVGDDATAAKVTNQLRARYGTPPTSPRYPQFTAGPIASSDVLVKDSELVAQWRTMLRHVLAIEMELAGAYRAARTATHEYPVVTVRAISDVVGLARDGAWTAYAAEVAAAFAHAFVRSWSEPPRSKT